MIRKIFPALMTSELISIQPMTKPTGKIFYMTLLSNEADPITIELYYLHMSENIYACIPERLSDACSCTGFCAHSIEDGVLLTKFKLPPIPYGATSRKVSRIFKKHKKQITEEYKKDKKISDRILMILINDLIIDLTKVEK